MKYRWILGFLLLLSIGCGETAVAPPPAEIITPTDALQKGARILSIDVTEASDGDFDAALNHAQAAGANTIELTVFWDDIETSPENYNPDPNWLEIANAYYPANATQVALTIPVIDTTTIRLPQDLNGKPMDDPLLIARFKELLNYVAAQTKDLTLVSLSIGNEVDTFLGTDAQQWGEFERFFAETAVYARTLWPHLPIGSKTTFDGITGEPAPFVQSLNQHTDAILATYYPLTPRFTVRPIITVYEDFQTLANTFPNQPIYLLEVGYPSGEDNDSSYAQQAEFIHELFTAWDNHANQIQLIAYTWLTDISPDAVKEFTRYYGLRDNGFASYLGTIGLRTFDGQEKPAYRQFVEEAKARGW